MKKTLISIALALASLASHAAFIDGEFMYQLISGDEGMQNVARGYIIGSIDVHNGMTFCLPKEATPDQLINIVEQVIITQEATRALPMDLMIYRLFGETFKCPLPGTGV